MWDFAEICLKKFRDYAIMDTRAGVEVANSSSDTLPPWVPGIEVQGLGTSSL
jgi:hypothetical protein